MLGIVVENKKAPGFLAGGTAVYRMSAVILCAVA